MRIFIFQKTKRFYLDFFLIETLFCKVLLRRLNVFQEGQADCLAWNLVVTKGGVVFLYPGKSFPRDPSLSVAPKPFDSVVAVSNRNRTTTGRSPFYPFYNGMRPPSFPRANDSSRRNGGKGTTQTPFVPY